MARLTTFQCAPVVDGISDDGEPRYQKPYPYHVLDNGRVQGLMRTQMVTLLGFQKNIQVNQVDLHWSFIVSGQKSLGACIGMYPVFVAPDGHFFALMSAVDEVTTRDFTDEQLEQLNG